MTDHVDVLIVGAGLSGIGAAASSPASTPAAATRSSSGARPAAAPGTSSAIPACAPTPTCSPSATASSRGPARARSPTARRSWPTSARPRPSTASTSTSATTTRSSRPPGTARPPPGRSPPRHRTAATQITASLLWSCSGYYDYDEGFTPTFEGADDFAGRIVHPQHWPEDLDHTGKQVVVIGSGATAVTLVPALAASGAEHVTMLQRTPTYILSVPAVDKLALRMRKVLGERRGYAANRWRNIGVATGLYQFSRRRPATVRKLIRRLTPRCCRTGTTSTPTSIRRTTRGTSGCASCRTATCSGRSRRAAPASSPTTSSASPRRA